MKWFTSKVLLVCCSGLLLATWSCTPKRETPKDRLKWSQTRLTNDYHTVGLKNPKWDQDVQEALGQYAKLNTAPADEEAVVHDLIGGAAETAVEAGCNDPMIKYLHCRYAVENTKRDLPKRQAQYRSAAEDLEASGYSPLWKLYANVSAAEILWQQRNTNLWPEVRQFRALAVGNLNQTLQDPTLPEQEAFGAADTVLQLLQRNTQELTNAYNAIAGSLFKDGSKSAEDYLIKADFYLLYAWRARGNGTASQVTETGWRLFRERLAVSEHALDKAWSLNPTDAQIPTFMILLAKSQQKTRPEMEQWFQRALKLAPDNYPACYNKLQYLRPEWYGSRDDMVAFGRECVTTTNAGSRLPLILVDAHSEFVRTLDSTEARGNYWRQPDVWPDIRSAYETYARLNPEATRFHYPYAWYAFRCGQWVVFHEQIKLIRQNEGGLNANYFGGQEAFDKMVEYATSLTAAIPAP
jgi:hypothetical protein